MEIEADHMVCENKQCPSPNIHLSCSGLNDHWLHLLYISRRSYLCEICLQNKTKSNDFDKAKHLMQHTLKVERQNKK